MPSTCAARAPSERVDKGGGGFCPSLIDHRYSTYDGYIHCPVQQCKPLDDPIDRGRDGNATFLGGRSCAFKGYLSIAVVCPMVLYRAMCTPGLSKGDVSILRLHMIMKGKIIVHNFVFWSLCGTDTIYGYDIIIFIGHFECPVSWHGRCFLLDMRG